MSFLKRLVGPRDVEDLKARADSQALIKLLDHPDHSLREKAAAALGELRYAEAVTPLIKALKDRDLTVRRQAAKSLGEIADLQAIDALVTAFDIGATAVYESFLTTAAESLTRFGQPGLDALAAIHEGGPYEVSEIAAVALGSAGDERGVPTLIRMLTKTSKAQSILKAIGAPAVEPLINALEATYRTRQDGMRKAIQLLGDLGDARAVSALRKHAQNSKLSRPCVNALAEIIERNGARVGADDLRALADFSDVEWKDERVKVYMNDEGNWKDRDTDTLNVLDCSSLREAAQLALKQRDDMNGGS